MLGAVQDYVESPSGANAVSNMIDHEQYSPDDGPMDSSQQQADLSHITSDDDFARTAASILEQGKVEDVLRDNYNIRKKFISVKDQLAVSTAKKKSLKVAMTQLEKDNYELRDTIDTFRVEVQHARQDYEEMHHSGTEAVRSMNEMRDAHIKEVRLLQKGLLNRGVDARNKVNDMADVMERLGRAVLSRDELAKENQKLKSQLFSSRTECRSLHVDISRTKAKSRLMEQSLRDASRGVTVPSAAAPKGSVGKAAASQALSSSCLSTSAMDGDDVEFEERLARIEDVINSAGEGAVSMDEIISKLNVENEALASERDEAVSGQDNLQKNGRALAFSLPREGNVRQRRRKATQASSNPLRPFGNDGHGEAKGDYCPDCKRAGEASANHCFIDRGV